MDNFQNLEEGVNLDEWEQIQSPPLNTQLPTRAPSGDWDMDAIRDNYLQDSLSFFPPSRHEGFPATDPQYHEVPNPPPSSSASPSSPSSSSSSSSSSNGFATYNSSSSGLRPCFENLSSGIARVAAQVRRYAVFIGGFCSFASVTGVLVAVLLSLVYAKVRRWRRRVQEENNRLILLIKQKDQKISELLNQIAQMNELLSARRKVPVLRI